MVSGYSVGKRYLHHKGHCSGIFRWSGETAWVIFLLDFYNPAGLWSNRNITAFEQPIAISYLKLSTKQLPVTITDLQNHFCICAAVHLSPSVVDPSASPRISVRHAAITCLQPATASSVRRPAGVFPDHAWKLWQLCVQTDTALTPSCITTVTI